MSSKQGRRKQKHWVEHFDFQFWSGIGTLITEHPRHVLEFHFSHCCRIFHVDG